MVLIFRLLRFVIPLLIMYLLLQVMLNFINVMRERSSYSSQKSRGNSNSKGGDYNNDNSSGGTRERNPYAILGCSPADSDDVIKKQYRILIARYHPDKFIGMDLDEDFIRLAARKFQEIQSAYDRIKVARKM